MTRTPGLAAIPPIQHFTKLTDYSLGSSPGEFAILAIV